MGDLSIRYLPLAELRKYPRNPKDHDLGALHESIARFGFRGAIMVDETSGCLAEGHGRVDALWQLKVRGEKPPRGVRVQGDQWLVPAIVGDGFADTKELEAWLIASNRTTMLGGWDEPLLADVLAGLKMDEALAGIGFDGDDLDALLRSQADGFVERDGDKRAKYDFLSGEQVAGGQGEGRMQAGYPLAIVLTPEEHDVWLARKMAAGVHNDKTFLLMLMENA